MHILQRLGRGLASASFKLCLLATAVTTALAISLGSPTKIKQALAKSDLYNQVVQSTLSQIKKNQQKQQRQPDTTTETEVPLDDATIKQIADQVFTPALLQQSSEEIIDGTYNWLEGDVSQPDFNVDLTAVKQNLAATIGNEAAKRVQALPICTPQQVRALGPDVDLFALPCRPLGLNLPAEREKLVAKVATSDEFLKEPVINAQTLKNDQGETPFQNASEVPTVFQWISRTPWIASALAVVAGALVFALHQDRRRGIFVLSRAILGVGLTLLIGTLITAFLFKRLQPAGELASEPGLQSALIAVARDISNSFNKVLLYFAVPYIVLGVGGFVGLRFTKAKQAATTPAAAKPTSRKPSSSKNP